MRRAALASPPTGDRNTCGPRPARDRRRGSWIPSAGETRPGDRDVRQGHPPRARSSQESSAAQAPRSPPTSPTQYLSAECCFPCEAEPLLLVQSGSPYTGNRFAFLSHFLRRMWDQSCFFARFLQLASAAARCPVAPEAPAPGASLTSREAEAVRPTPPSLEVRGPVTFALMPGVVPVT